MDPIRVLVVDDHPRFRNGLRTILSSADGIEWIGEAGTGREAIELSLRLQPDVVLMNIQMPDLNGVEATRQIVKDSPHIGVLILTMYDDDDLVFATMQAGARGYLLKAADQNAILRAIQAVDSGETIFSPGIAQRLIAYFTEHRAAALPPEIFPELTEREREILDLMPAGHNNTEIAERLTLSGKTVRNHVSNIFSQSSEIIVTVNTSPIPPLPPAVESAAYCIVLEALTNCVRHAHATTCCIRVAFDDGLRLEVHDNGQGLPANYRRGVGISSMQERASELGGKCVVEQAAGGGTIVSARLPIVGLLANVSERKEGNHGSNPSGGG